MENAVWPWLLPVMAAAIGLAAVPSGGVGRDPDVASPVLIDEPAPPRAGPMLGGGHSDVQFVGLNTRDTVADAEAFLEEMGGASYPSVLDADGRKAAEWGVVGVPQTFLVDKHDRIRAKTVGAVTREWLLSGVQQLLTGQGIS